MERDRVERRCSSPRSAFAVALALACAACSPDGRSPDFFVQGAGILVDSSAPFAHQADFPARLESTITEALAYWGGGWSQLAGRTITFSGERSVPCGGGQSLGCFDGDVRLTTIDPGTGTFRCVEQTSLVHEIGHAVLGDPMHDDPRWMELDSVALALGGRPGYGETSTGDCLIWVSVWRHPLGRR
jgi:hypothetical protein